MKTTVIIFLTILKVGVMGYTGYKFFHYFRSDGHEALKYLGIFLFAALGITALELILSFI